MGKKRWSPNRASAIPVAEQRAAHKRATRKRRTIKARIARRRG